MPRSRKAALISATVRPVGPKSTTNSLKKPDQRTSTPGTRAIRCAACALLAGIVSPPPTTGWGRAFGRDRLADLDEALGSHQRHVDGVDHRPEVDGVARPVVAVLARAVG